MNQPRNRALARERAEGLSVVRDVAFPRKKMCLHILLTRNDPRLGSGGRGGHGCCRLRTWRGGWRENNRNIAATRDPSAQSVPITLFKSARSARFEERCEVFICRHLNLWHLTSFLSETATESPQERGSPTRSVTGTELSGFIPARAGGKVTGAETWLFQLQRAERWWLHPACFSAPSPVTQRWGWPRAFRRRQMRISGLPHTPC